MRVKLASVSSAEVDLCKARRRMDERMNQGVYLLWVQIVKCWV